MEIAGTCHHMENNLKAEQNLKKACLLGQQEACRLLTAHFDRLFLKTGTCQIMSNFLQAKEIEDNLSPTYLRFFSILKGAKCCHRGYIYLIPVI